MSDEKDFTLVEQVALEILGWEYVQHAPPGHFCLSSGNDKGWWKEPEYPGWGCAVCSPVPRYDIDPCVVGDVEDKLIALGYNIRYVWKRKGGYWRCQVYRPDKDGKSGGVGMAGYSAQRGEALCIAGLRAVRAEKEAGG